MKTIKLDVNGMRCSHCETAVKKALLEITGVKEVEVSAKTKHVIVKFEEMKTQENQIIEVIKEEGYEIF